MSMPPRQRTVSTTTPDPAPLRLACPNCAAPLAYDHSVMSGVGIPERWDLFDCGKCGQFEYRHRTRQLRRTIDVRPIARLLMSAQTSRRTE
jgi:hypothetical protein